MCQRLATSIIGVVLLAGCAKPPPPPPAPRPVAIVTLIESDPGRLDRVTGAAASWKTDELGFEVEGRVEFVNEPETDIKGQLGDTKGNVITEGTLLAKLDPTRYELAVDSAKAQVLVAEKQRDALAIELNSVFPQQEEAALAARDLAEIEFDRNKTLAASNAAAERAVDLSASMLRRREAELKELEASKEAKAAELAASEARIAELQGAQSSAERDLADCELYSSYAGQIADVHVVPGSVVRQGQQVVTVQMMDPIKVEVEVSAATARRLNHRDQVAIHVPQPNGDARKKRGFIYTIDPVADSQTRTFTVTLMLRNERVGVTIPDELRGQGIARAHTLRKVFRDLPGLSAGLFVNKKSIYQDDEGSYVWKILNRRIGTLDGEPDPLLRVKKVRIQLGERQVSFLGLATMHEIKLVDESALDVDVDMIVGDISPPDGQETWDGEQLIFDRHRWFIRPGDLVGVDLRGAAIPSGIYVPFDAIMERSGANFVFAVDETSDGDTCRQVNVTVHESAGTLRRIEAVGDEVLTLGTKIVASGAAFLVDGDAINVAKDLGQ